MRAFFASFLGLSGVLIPLIFMTPSLSPAQNSKKGKLNTQLFEKDDQEPLISGKVKVVREVQGETEVFIENPKGSSGPYVLPQSIKNRASVLKILNNSKKPGGPPVTISIDDNQQIKSVEESETSHKTLDWGS